MELTYGYHPGLIGRIGELHGSFYAHAWGTQAPFEILMIRELCEFVEHLDPERDLLLSVSIDSRVAGAIAILGREQTSEGVQLRFFLVDPQFQGAGAGKMLLKTALDWCRSKGYKRVFLWTVDNLPQSRHLYEKNGFAITLRCRDDRYTVPRDVLKMECQLS